MQEGAHREEAASKSLDRLLHHSKEKCLEGGCRDEGVHPDVESLKIIRFRQRETERVLLYLT